MDYESLGLSPRVLDPSEIEEVLAFEEARLSRADASDEARLLSWNAPWRLESLRHYIPTGWCFALRDSRDRLRAYFLAQPLLFYGGLTQTLWVEYLAYDDADTLTALVDLARRYARDKHLQKVAFHVPTSVDLSATGAARVSMNVFELVTTKMA